MRVAMDSDCLIKLTKAGLKEKVCAAWAVSIPSLVEQETVKRAPHRPDAVRIGENITAGHLEVRNAGNGHLKGEDEVLTLFKGGGFDAVASDDGRFIRRLRGLGIPFAVPVVIIVCLRQENSMTDTQARDALTALRPHISADEHATAWLMLTGGVVP
jgi:hypothetical protein